MQAVKGGAAKTKTQEEKKERGGVSRGHRDREKEGESGAARSGRRDWTTGKKAVPLI